jgi:hypothetical protein
VTVHFQPCGLRRSSSRSKCHSHCLTQNRSYRIKPVFVKQNRLPARLDFFNGSQKKEKNRFFGSPRLSICRMVKPLAIAQDRRRDTHRALGPFQQRVRTRRCIRGPHRSCIFRSRVRCMRTQSSNNPSLCRDRLQERRSNKTGGHGPSFRNCRGSC